ncbi:hypothetical protein SE17_20795, partial [Kouleothrix aurantiaca]
MWREFASRDELVAYLRAEFPAAAAIDDHVSPVIGGRAAADAMPDEPGSLLHGLATPETVSGADVSRAAAAGDALAQRLMEREAELLGLGFVNLLHLFAPEQILVGGSVIT